MYDSKKKKRKYLNAHWYKDDFVIYATATWYSSFKSWLQTVFYDMKSILQLFEIEET